MGSSFKIELQDVDDGVIIFDFNTRYDIATEVADQVTAFMAGAGYKHREDYTLNTVPWKLGQPVADIRVAVYFKDPEKFVMFKLQHVDGVVND